MKRDTLGCTVGWGEVLEELLAAWLTFTSLRMGRARRSNREKKKQELVTGPGKTDWIDARPEHYRLDAELIGYGN